MQIKLGKFVTFVSLHCELPASRCPDVYPTSQNACDEHVTLSSQQCCRIWRHITANIHVPHRWFRCWSTEYRTLNMLISNSFEHLCNIEHHVILTLSWCKFGHWICILLSIHENFNVQNMLNIGGDKPKLERFANI